MVLEGGMKVLPASWGSVAGTGERPWCVASWLRRPWKAYRSKIWKLFVSSDRIYILFISQSLCSKLQSWDNSNKNEPEKPLCSLLNIPSLGYVGQSVCLSVCHLCLYNLVRVHSPYLCILLNCLLMIVFDMLKNVAFPLVMYRCEC